MSSRLSHDRPTSLIDVTEQKRARRVAVCLSVCLETKDVTYTLSHRRIALHGCCVKLEFHDADTDTDILARKQRVSDVETVAAFGESVSVSVSVSVSAPWNASLMELANRRENCTQRVEIIALYAGIHGRTGRTQSQYFHADCRINFRTHHGRR